ncbi:DNA-binding response regulator [Macrococcoides caseolyticum]|uniref:DNA-binding response regulator n=1 Tax=Macrococcoides caseolyticum TaxID=69966 RepID=A0A855GPX8_9STAP|nr:response regulator transcription factor [Macrococcus caseolyticus]PKE06877.1 DNA-binding response regulator [Macrococcus caseolyticus]PKE21508.1 DNA-binding response regulator [Macrococcus caseolyticus]PKE24074.1 DNA-binding response regulator [Macrococcus caseolyticus]PKE25838.1 DNA-binding response regulator [Macrococcus caseolyticus]PKE53301.1 DNA-binding response regulator [Macrococcus caseolyticus]
MKIMIVEDDPVIREHLAEALKKWGYEVYIANNFNDIIEEFNDYKPHIVLLDINLPAYNGYHWCQEIRKISQIPIIFISSRNDSMDQVMAMQMGADDYIEKPFNMTVTVSKVQAMLRRSYDFSILEKGIEINGAELITEQAKLSFRDKHIDLTLTELQIMQSLFKANGGFVSRNALIESCWESEHFIDDNTLAVNMTRLRKKLQNIGLDNFIETKKNVGYRVVK